MKRILEEIIFNMEHAKFESPQMHIDALKYARSLLK
jgi:hypothetical protein